MSIWRIESIKESAEAFHGRDLPAERAIWRATINDSAVVLGSRQESSIVNHAACEKDGIAVVHRRSGGGVVFLETDAHLWLDFVVPRDDELWCEDVGKAMWWLGDLWADALAKCEVADRDQLRVHRGGLESSALSDLVCFGGLGPGEVTLHGKKVVGISQRRTRDKARFQCVVHRHWSPESYRKYLLLDAMSQSSNGFVRGVGVEVASLAVAEVAGLNQIGDVIFELATAI